MSRARVALSLGDPGGISYGVAAAALGEFLPAAAFSLFGDPARWRAACARAGAGAAAALPFAGEFSAAASYPAAPAPENGRVALDALAAAAAAVRRGDSDLLVTAPLSKTAVRHHDPGFTGHSEFLRAACGGAPILMSFFSERFKVALHTTHLPLRAVWDHLTAEKLLDGLTRLDAAWREWFAAAPEIGLAGLNPHAGEGGAFGAEETDILLPAARAARSRGLRVSDPLPPDTLTRQRGFDVFYALHHDQGLIAAKALPEEAAQVTLGLPFIRTSPDHGVAYDLAAEPGRASPEGMRVALRWALRLHALRPR